MYLTLSLTTLFALTLLFASNVQAAEQTPKEKEAAPVEIETHVNGFALKLYGKLKDGKGNIVFSPYSIYEALAMATNGASGQTHQQMVDVLNSHQPPAKMAALTTLRKQLLADTGKDAFTFTIANRLWGQEGYPYEKTFLMALKDDFGAPFAQLDITNNPEAARETINTWVEKQTRDRIKNLLPSGAITTDTRLVLVNAVYFLADWRRPFKNRSTHEADFHLEGGKTVKVKMMRGSKWHLPYFENDELQAVQLAYKGGQVSMLLLLPKSGTLADLEAKLDNDLIAAIDKDTNSAATDIFLPKWKVTETIALKNPLEALGITDAFIPATADFSRITTAEKLFIAAAIHKAFVKVDEKGTEAAAATALTLAAGSASMNQPKLFRADKPFLWMIRDNESGTILFMGRVADPTQ